MPTEAQSTANRANSKKSTGPRTAEGKARSAQNSTTHGLFAAALVIPDADRPAHKMMADGLRDQLHPDGALEEAVFANLVAASWNLRRVRALLVALYDGALDPLANLDLDAQVDRLSRYEQRFERAFYRAVAELRRLQTDAAAIDHAVNEEDATAWSPLIDVRRALSVMRTRAFTDRATFAAELADLASVPLPPLNGFVLPDQSVEAA